MQLTTILSLLIALAASSTAWLQGDIVPPGYGESIPEDQRFKPNFNHTDWYENRYVPRFFAGDPATAASSVLNGNVIKIWPRDPVNPSIRAVEYCYENADTKAQVQQTVEAAIKLWTDALGPPRAGSHNVQFEETWSFCTIVENGELFWNPSTPKHALRIQRSPNHNAGGAASPGYTYKDGMSAGVHFMLIGVLWPHAVAHEFAHVLGMAHEFNRLGRDADVYYDCTKVFDYHAKLALAQQRGFNADQMCNDINIAVLLGFSGQMFVQGWMVGGYSVSSDGTPYDTLSITNYESGVNAIDPTKCGPWKQETPWECPMSAYLDPKDHTKGLKYIDEVTKPSVGDVEWVKLKYKHD